MKLKFIANFFLRNNQGFFRSSFLLPLFGIFFGSFIIFMTYTIMNGLENKMRFKMNSFFYKQNNCTDLKENSINSINDNSGCQKIVNFTSESTETLVEMFLFNDLDNYLSKIKPFLENNDNAYNGILIGDDLARNLNIDIGDSIEISFPTNINISTLFFPYDLFVVSGIYDLDLFDYDVRYAFISKDLTDSIIDDDCNCSYSDNSSMNNINMDLLIDAIELEKKIYVGLSFFVIFISCIMIFNIMTVVMIDKGKQLEYLKILGFNNSKIFYIMLCFNSVISFVVSLFGYLFSEFFVVMYHYYGLFSFLFDSLPFKIDPFSNNFFSIIFIYLFINTLIVIFSTLPYKLRTR